ncbi:outer membrane protein assembly factor BamB [Colwellia sp. PAMC 21821]|uniref:outer membrane protein assembly factor BamB n=1 Tax=Colwellia sp. PAMC 21821 TaxID=1816219 RepID=UPI0009BD0755|nr:outer membrane protein assembly factor BamB [Colwellia sp. PAMC 21821]ARD44950.1 outer membrane protein assembly factor BamB [Colwellia sp. PAMC 21821]
MFTSKRFNKSLLAICFLAVGISACSSTDDEDEDLRVAELTEIEALFEPVVKWDVSVGDGVGRYFSRIQPVVAYGKVFSASRDGEAYAFDENTGEKIWYADLSDVENKRGFFDDKVPALISGGAVAGINKVFYGSENGDVIALEAESGKLSWQGKVKGEVIAAPALDSGKLVVNTASGVMKAFNASNGQDDWQVEQDVPPLTLRGISAPTIAGGGVIVGSADGSLSVYLLEQGRQGWTVDIGEAAGSTELERVIDVDSTPLVYGDNIYTVSSRGNLSAVELRSGRVLWQRQYSSYNEISISGNSLFLTDVKGHVYAIDRNNGLELWSQLSFTNRGVTGPVPFGNYVVIGDFEGYLHWLDQSTGEVVARHHVDSSGIHATPTVENNVLYSQARNGDLEAITISK